MTRWRSPTPSIGAAVELDDHVAGPDARRRRGAAVEELDDLESAPPAERGRRAPAGAAASRRRRRGTPAGRDRRASARTTIARVAALIGTASPRPIAGDRRVDADDPAARVGERAAGVARVERRVGLDDVLDEPAGSAVARRERPAEGADDAGRHAAGEAERVADRDDELADPQPVGVAERRGGELAAGRADDREVRERVATDDLERELRAVDEAWPCRRAAPATTWAEVSEVAVGGERDRRSGAAAPAVRRPDAEAGDRRDQPLGGAADGRASRRRGPRRRRAPRRRRPCAVGPVPRPSAVPRPRPSRSRRRRPRRSARRCRGRP